MRNKQPKVLRASVVVSGEESQRIVGETYNHGTLELYLDNGESRAWLQLKFQRHLLTTRTTALSAAFQSEPYAPFDFGQPWTAFYGGRVATEFDVEFAGPEHMLRAARYIQRVRKVMADRNLRLVTACDLGQWVEALKAMGVRVNIECNMPGLPDCAIHELHERHRHPAHRHLKALKRAELQDRAAAADASIGGEQ